MELSSIITVSLHVWVSSITLYGNPGLPSPTSIRHPCKRMEYSQVRNIIIIIVIITIVIVIIIINVTILIIIIVTIIIIIVILIIIIIILIIIIIVIVISENPFKLKNYIGWMRVSRG